MIIFISKLFLYFLPCWQPVFAVALSGTDSDIFLKHPESQSVTLNSTFTLDCRFKIKMFQNPKNNIGPRVHWSKNGFGLGNTREDIQTAGMGKRYKYSRYDLPFNLNEGQYDLQITNAEASDEGKYTCQLTYEGRTYLSQNAMVFVLIPSETPVLLQLNPNDLNGVTTLEDEKHATVVEGDLLKLRCIARDGKPGARLVWLLNGIPMKIDWINSTNIGRINNGMEGNVSYSSIQGQQFPHLVTTTSDITAYVTKLHHGQQIKCNAENIGYERFKQNSAQTSLSVLYPPFVKMRIQSANEGLHLAENDVITIHCSAEGRPDNFRWRWSVNGTDVPDIKVPRYRLRLTHDFHDVPVRCTATTFKSEYTEVKLAFSYAPRFHQSQNILYAGSLDENVQMHCSADGNPKPVIEWRRGSGGELLTRGEVLYRQKIKPDDFGTYICTATVEGFPPISKEAILAKKVSPSIKPMKPVLAGIGSSVRIPCTVYSVPLPSRKELLWNRRGVPLRETSHRQFLSEEFIGGVIHVMFLKHVMATDFGFYNCSASNGFGSSWQTVELRKEDDLAITLLPGISSALVILIVISIVVVFCCRRRQNRIKNIKNGIFTGGISVFNNHSESTRNGCGNMMPSALRNSYRASFSDKVQEDLCGNQSTSNSTEIESVNRYQYPSNLRTSLVRQPVENISVDQYMRSVSPICSYALIGDQPLPVCTNMAVAFTDANGLHLPQEMCMSSFTVPGSYTSPCNEYRPLSVFNAPSLPTSETFQFSSPSESDATTTIQHLGYIPVNTLPADSDIILNTQVTNV